MELSSFSENIVVRKFSRNGEDVELQINIDAMVPDYFAQLEQRLTPVTDRIAVLVKQYEDIQAEMERREKEAKKDKKNKAKLEPLPSLLPLEKELAEIKRESFAERLTCPVLLPDGSTTCLLKGWSIVEQGAAIAPSKENLMRLPPKAVEQLWEECIASVNTVKKRVDEETGETSENTHSGSRAPLPLALAPTG